MSKPQYLTDQWFIEAAERVAAKPFPAGSKEPIAFSFEISQIPDGHPGAGTVVRYRISVNPEVGIAALSRSDEPGDVRFAMTFDVAYDVASGAVSGSRAFLDGCIRLGGNVAALIERADDLKALNGLIGAGDA
jgi:hypothetical protein